VDIGAHIQQLEDMIRDAKSMPLSASALMNREELLEVVNGMKEALPEEIKQARWVVKDREELMAKARRDADQLLEKAQTEQAQMLSEQAVVQAAHDEAERILGEARDHVRQMRLEAEDYVDSKLAQFEAVIARIQEALAAAEDSMSKVRGQVEGGREKLRGTHPAAALQPEHAGSREESR
jgi:cell division septum initiation protein DivIVA